LPHESSLDLLLTGFRSQQRALGLSHGHSMQKEFHIQKQMMRFGATEMNQKIQLCRL
jgi:hypothetical protein